MAVFLAEPQGRTQALTPDVHPDLAQAVYREFALPTLVMHPAFEL